MEEALTIETASTTGSGKSSGKRAVSLKKIEANRRNAQRSTGPRTEQGKNVVRWNALKDGILAGAIIVGAEMGHNESSHEFYILLEQLSRDLHPSGPLEEILVEKIAVSYWRLRRVIRSETAQIYKSIGAIPDFLRARRSWTKAFHEAPETEKQEAKWMSNERERSNLAPKEATENIIRYEAAVERQLYRALHQLERIQRRRAGEAVPPPLVVDHSA